MSRDDQRALHIEPGLDRAGLARFHAVQVEAIEPAGFAVKGCESVAADRRPYRRKPSPRPAPSSGCGPCSHRGIRAWPRGCWRLIES